MLVQVGLAGLGLVAATAPTWWIRRHVRALLHFVEDGTRTPSPEDLTALQALDVLVRGATVPKPQNARTPEDFGFPYTTTFVDVPDGHRLEVWTVPGECGQVVLFHGYTAPKDQVLDALPWFRERGYTVHLVDFRASGGSSGTRTTLGVEEAHDVAAIVRWAHGRRDGPLVLYGFSMGGAAVLGALGAEELPVDALIVDAVYDRLSTTLGHRFRSMGVPPSPGRELIMLLGSFELRRNAWGVAPVLDAQSVQPPTLVLTGTEDPRVSLVDAAAIHDALPNGTLVALPGGGHDPGFISSPAAWDEAVDRFLQAHTPTGRHPKD